MNENQFIINGQRLTIANLQDMLCDTLIPDWKTKIYNFILDWFNNDEAIIQKTSGSTGVPKEIKLEKNAMIASAKATIAFFNLQPNDTAWLCLPVDYIAGKMMVVRSLIGNLNLLISQPDGNPAIPDQNIDFTALVPLQIQKLIDANANFYKIKKIIIGGAAVNPDMTKAIQSIHSEVYATYGMTETCSHIALQALNHNLSSEWFTLLPGISISKNNNDCLIINAPHLSKIPLVTNDIVEMHSPTEFKILGRADNVMNSGGIKILPEELENVISQIINTPCIVSGKKDRFLGTRIVLVLEEKINKPDTNSLLQKISSIIGKHKTPKEIAYIKKFPLNPSMKIDRKKVELLINSKNDQL